MSASDLRGALAMRWKRRRLLWRAFRRRRELSRVVDRTEAIDRGAILGFVTVRNEADRLPYFLQHYRKIGVEHFLVVDNGSTDGTRELLIECEDISLWGTHASYKAARFGMDWLTWLHIRYGHGHWCLTVDADELLIYPHWEKAGLAALTRQLVSADADAMGALMIELYPKGPLSSRPYKAGADPLDTLEWFDPAPYRKIRQKPMTNLWVQGGPRERVFFPEAAHKAPTLNKLPLVNWNRRFVYANSTHSILPPRLNTCWDGPGDPRLSGALLHTKFLDTVIEKSREEKLRKEHFGDPDSFASYYDGLIADPDFWHPDAARFEGWEQLEAFGLLSRGAWREAPRANSGSVGT